MFVSDAAVFRTVLSRSFLRTLNWAAATSFLWGGCGGDSSEPRPFTTGLQPTAQHGGVTAISCRPTWQPLRGFNPPERWDYMSLHRRDSSAEAAVLLQELGELCADAPARDACLAEAARLSGPMEASGMFLLGTQAGQVRTFRGKQALALFGEVDRVDEAMWMVQAQTPAHLDKACHPSTKAHEQSDGTFIIDSVVAGAGDPCEIGAGRADRIFSFFVTRDGTVNETSASATRLPHGCSVPGRRPSGLCQEPPRAVNEQLGALLAREAHAEAASVWAFDALARELRAHAAPLSLWHGARRARQEEARHAGALSRLARRYGGEPRWPRVWSLPLRSLSEIALDNAVEGCVRETYAALRVAYQAQRAQDPECARVMAQLADDELRHASWSWQLAHWVEPRLSETARRQVRAARAQALHELVRETHHAVEHEAQRLAGYPSVAAAERLVAGVRAAAAELNV